MDAKITSKSLRGKIPNLKILYNA